MEKLGIEPTMLVAQVVNFLIVLAVLTKFLYKPIQKTLNDRKAQIAKIDQGLQSLVRDREQLENLKEQELDKAQGEAGVILNDAKAEAEALKAEIINSGHQEVLLLKQKLETEMVARLAEAKKELAGQTVEVSLEILRKLLPGVLTKKDRQEYLTKQLAKLQKTYEI